MTNKPMLSVERLLMDIRQSCELSKSRDAQIDAALVELRALLDKPNSWPCWSCKQLVSMRERADADGECPHCAVELDLEDWPFPNKPAAQHQGEPVALQHIAVSEGGVLRWMAGRKMQHCELYAMPDGSAIRSNLYAAQHAPLKIGSGVTVENIGFGPEEERKPYLVFSSYGCLTEVNLIDVSLVSKRQAHTIADLEAIGVLVEKPAPVAMVLPDDWEDQLFAEMSRRFDLRKMIDDDHMVYDDTQIGVEFASDWIKARLNGVKP